MTDFQEELLLQSEELPLPDLGSMDLMEMLEMQIMERLLNFLIRNETLEGFLYSS